LISQTQNNFMLDGFDNNHGTQNAQSLSLQVVQPNPDAIEQFKVQTNSFSAEFGRSAGAVVNVSIKSGSNAIRGSSWYYNRDASLAAISWNAKTNGLPKDDLKWNAFGAICRNVTSSDTRSAESTSLQCERWQADRGKRQGAPRHCGRSKS
jgi:hypothetical protein